MPEIIEKEPILETKAISSPETLQQELLDNCADAFPRASEQQKGLFPHEQFRSFLYKEFPVKAGETRALGMVSGLCTLEIPEAAPRPTVLFVTPLMEEYNYYKGWDQMMDLFEFSFNETREFQITNLQSYDITVHAAYQNIGIHKV